MRYWYWWHKLRGHRVQRMERFTYTTVQCNTCHKEWDETRDHFDPPHILGS